MSEPPNRREVILTEAAELFARNGITGTTVREIADAVGVLSGSLYHHFKSKDEIVGAIMTEYLEDLTAEYREAMETTSDPRTQLTDLVQRSLSVTERHPYATEIYQNSGNYLRKLDNAEFIRQSANTISSTWINVLEDGVDKGVFRADIKPRVTYRLLRDALWLSVRWFRPTSEYSLQQFGDDLVATFCDGLLARP